MEHVLQDKAPQPAGRLQNSNLAQAWLVLVLALVLGAALAAVQVRLSPIIAANKLNETLRQVPELVGLKAADLKPGAMIITPGTIGVNKNGNTAFYRLYRVLHEGRPAGWVVKAAGQGYADRIEVLIGFDPGLNTITGLFILEQKETPGLGAKVARSSWRGQFVGRKTGVPLVVVKGRSDGSDGIDAVSGATISSRSVVRIVNRAVSDLAGRLTPDAVRFSGGKQ
jgi:electron transport complex protein RnfG